MLWVIFWALVLSSLALAGLIFSDNPLITGRDPTRATLVERGVVLLSVPALLAVTMVLYLTSAATEGRFPSWPEVLFALSDIYDLARAAIRPE